MRQWTVSQLAKHWGLSRSTLLYYERIGLLRSGRRSRAGYRIYTAEDAARLQKIRLYRQAGLPLEDIGKILAGPRKPEAELLEKRLAELGREILELRAQQRLIAALLREQGHSPDEMPVDKQGWVAMLEKAGMDERAMWRWHHEFEERSPQAHYEFLMSLGIEEREAERIRHWSRRTTEKEQPDC